MIFYIRHKIDFHQVVSTEYLIIVARPKRNDNLFDIESEDLSNWIEHSLWTTYTVSMKYCSKPIKFEA